MASNEGRNSPIRLSPSQDIAHPCGNYIIPKFIPKDKQYKDLPLEPLGEDDIQLGGLDEGNPDRWEISFKEDDLCSSKDELKSNVLRGDFSNVPPPRSHVVRIFLSSTFTDMQTERNALHRSAHPILQQFCQDRGLEYQVVDMRWGVTDEAVSEHLTSDLCLHEIQICQRLSAGPSFVTMLGNRYGYRPLQVKIPADEFECLQSVVEKSAEATWKKWYKRDNNAVPPMYVLQPIGSVLKHFSDTAESNADLRQADRQKWSNESTFLYKSITAAADEAVKKGLIESSRLQHYSQSVTEEEVYQGVIENPEPNKQCVAFHRQLTGFEPYLNKDEQVHMYIDIIERDGEKEIDKELQTRLHQLAVKKVPTVLAERNLFSYRVEWNKGGISSKIKDHKKYLQRFCRDFTDKVLQLIEEYSDAEFNVSKKADPVIEEIEQHARFCVEKCSTFCGRSKVLDEVKFYLESKQQLPLIIHGESGMGKTSVMAMVNQLLHKWFPGCNTILRFLGTSKGSSSITALLQSICIQLCYLYNINIPTTAVLENFTTISKFFHALLAFIANQPELSNTPLFILLDSLDQLSSSDGAHLLTWLPRILPNSVHIIVSTIPKIHGILDRLLGDPLMTNGNNFIELEGLDAAAGADVLKTKLEKSSRKLSSWQEQILITAFQECPQALYIKLAIDEVLSWHSYDIPQDNRLRYSVQEAIIQLFVDMENKFGSTIVKFALGYITATCGGLSQVELEDVLSCNDQVLNDVYQYHNPPTEGIVRIPPLLWARISYDLKEYLSEREVDGKTVIFWYHRQFEEVARDKFVERVHEKAEDDSSCCGGYMSHGHRLHYDLVEIFNAEAGIQRTIHLHHRKVTIKDANRCVIKQTHSAQNLRWLNALPFHLMQPNFHCDETCQQLSEQTLCNFNWILAKLERFSPSYLLREYNRVVESCHCQHDEIVFMRDFLMLAEPGVLYRPTLLATEVLTRLPNIPKLSEYPNIQKVIKDAEAWLQKSQKSEIYPVQPCFEAPNGLLKSCIVGPQRLIALPNDARFVVGSSRYAKVRLGVWSTSSNELLHILELPPGDLDLTKTKMDQKGSVVVTVEDTTRPKDDEDYPKNDIMLKVYNLAEGTLKLRLRVGKDDECTCLDLSADGILVAVASLRGLVYVVDLETRRIGCIEAHSGPVKNVHFCPDGCSIITSGCSQNSLTGTQHVASWILPSLKKGYSTDIPFFDDYNLFCISRNSQSLFAICGENTLLYLQIPSGAGRLIQCIAPLGHLTCLALSWDGQTAVVGGSEGHVWVVHTQELQDQYEPVLTTDSKGVNVSSLHQIAVMWDGQFAVGATSTGKIYIWHLPILEKVKIIDAHATAINGLSSSTDHELLFSSAPDLHIKVWRIGRLLRQYLCCMSSEDQDSDVSKPTATSDYKRVQLTADGKLAIFEAAQGPPELWDVCLGQRLHALIGPACGSSSTVLKVALSPEGDKLIVLSDLGQFSYVTSIGVHIWDMALPKRQLLLASHTAEANVAAVSPDSSIVVFGYIKSTYCRGGAVHLCKPTRCTISIWSTETMKTVKEFDVNCEWWGEVKDIIITPDKKFAVIFGQVDQADLKNQHYQLEVIDLEAKKLLPKPIPKTASESEVPSTNMADVQVTKGCVVTRIRLPLRFYGRLGRPTKANRYLVETCWGQVWEIDAKEQTIHRVFHTKFKNLRQGSGAIKSLAVSDDRQWLAIGTAGGSSLIFDLKSGRNLLRTRSPHNQVWSIDISRDKSLLVCGYRNNMIEVWDVKSKRLVCDVMTHADVAKLVITPDNNYLVAIVDNEVKPKPIFLKLEKPRQDDDSLDLMDFWGNAENLG